MTLWLSFATEQEARTEGKKHRRPRIHVGSRGRWWVGVYNPRR